MKTQVVINRDETGKFMSGNKHPRWKGGRKIARGYVFIRKPDHPLANATGYVQEHRLVLEQFLGRCLKKSETSHHINKNRLDNRLSNLILFRSHSIHLKFEYKHCINPKDIVFDGRKLKPCETQKEMFSIDNAV